MSRPVAPTEVGATIGLVALLAIVACGQERAPSAVPSEWEDPSSHRVQHVSVGDDVRLEVLDWGGTGRAVVLLAGSGNTAHVFDDFAPDLTDCCHVYGITRRGFGASSQPPSGYDDQRLADDILGVLDSIGIDDPVLVGHSMAGGEMTTIGSQHSDRVAALVYMDALADPVDAPFNDAAYMALVDRLPAGKRQSPALDYSSFDAYIASQKKSFGNVFPEAELRNGFAGGLDGQMGTFRTPRLKTFVAGLQ